MMATQHKEGKHCFAHMDTTCHLVHGRVVQHFGLFHVDRQRVFRGNITAGFLQKGIQIVVLHRIRKQLLRESSVLISLMSSSQVVKSEFSF